MKLLSFLSKLWYPFSIQSALRDNEIKKCDFFSKEYVMYRDGNKSIVIHSNICPHQGGHFSNNGFLDKNHNIVCPYHGFTYHQGSFIGICHQKQTASTKKELNTFQVMERDNLIFIRDQYPSNSNLTDYEIFSPPEEYNSSFRSVSGFQILSNNYLSVTENLLDMLHISFVHSFGSKFAVPSNIHFQKLSEIHGRTLFEYTPAKKSLGTFLSSKEQKNVTVKIENEFILPTNTITRVFIENSIKTVFTRSIPIDENKTLLYWTLYRNFWMENLVIQYIGDFFIKYLMENVIQEDVQILKNINVNDRNGIIKTKFDKTILKFRQFMKKWEKNNTK